MEANLIHGGDTLYWGALCRGANFMQGSTLYAGEQTLCRGINFMQGSKLYAGEQTLCR